MKILKSYKEGIIQTAGHRRMLIYLWVINMVISLVAAIPLISLITRGLSRSLMGDQVARKVSMLWFGDLSFRIKEIGGSMGSWLIVPVILYLLLHIFLNGGIISQLSAGNKTVTLGSFLKGGGDYFWRFFKLFAISVIFYIFAVTFLHGIISQILNIFKKQAVTGWTFIIVSNISMIILILLISIVNMIFDYAKILTVTGKEKKVLCSLKNALRFLRNHFFRAWGLFLMLGLGFITATIIYMEIAQIMAVHTVLMVMILFLWQQIFIFAKIGIKVQFFGSQMNFLQLKETKLE